jgi:hypothetical protein
VTEREWDVLVRSGRQVEHQAAQLLLRPRGAWEWTVPEAVRLHRWAVAVLASMRDTARSH